MFRHLSIQQLKTFDSYAKPVQLTFRGEEAYATKIGGAVSLICAVIFSALLMIKTI